MSANEDSRRERIQEKVAQFTILMKEISEEINTLFLERKEKEYHDLIVEMIKALDESQQIVRKAYHKSLSRIDVDN